MRYNGKEYLWLDGSNLANHTRAAKSLSGYSLYISVGFTSSSQESTATISEGSTCMD